jgi:hypothetical protein
VGLLARAFPALAAKLRGSAGKVLANILFLAPSDTGDLDRVPDRAGMALLPRGPLGIALFVIRSPKQLGKIDALAIRIVDQNRAEQLKGRPVMGDRLTGGVGRRHQSLLLVPLDSYDLIHSASMLSAKHIGSERRTRQAIRQNSN